MLPRLYCTPAGPVNRCWAKRRSAACLRFGEKRSPKWVGFSDLGQKKAGGAPTFFSLFALRAQGVAQKM